MSKKIKAKFSSDSVIYLLFYIKLDKKETECPGAMEDIRLKISEKTASIGFLDFRYYFINLFSKPIF